ncbi:hypothetical protein Unana1_07382 [Umbelopsis nana]
MVVFSSPPVERGMLPANEIQFKFGFVNRLVADGHKVAQFVTTQPTYISGAQALLGGDTLLACMAPIKYDGASTQQLMQGANYGILEEFAGPCLNNQYTSTLSVSLYENPNAPGSLNWDTSW